MSTHLSSFPGSRIQLWSLLLTAMPYDLIYEWWTLTKFFFCVEGSKVARESRSIFKLEAIVENWVFCVWKEFKSQLFLVYHCQSWQSENLPSLCSVSANRRWRSSMLKAQVPHFCTLLWLPTRCVAWKLPWHPHGQDGGCSFHALFSRTIFSPS